MSSIPNSLRWRALERDAFTCVYCGAKAPDVRLEVDHVVPKSRGGKDVLENLATSCSVCNQSKKARRLPEAVLERVQEAASAPTVRRPGPRPQARPRLTKKAPKVRLVTNLGNVVYAYEIPVSPNYVEVQPGELLTKFRCSHCGHLNEYGYDECMCRPGQGEGGSFTYAETDACAACGAPVLGAEELCAACAVGQRLVQRGVVEPYRW